MDKQPIIGQTPQEQQKDDPRVLVAQIAYVNHVQNCATSRKSRLEDLMQRRSSKKWDAKKKAKMVRRLMVANSELEQTALALADLGPRLQAFTGPARVNNVAPFVQRSAGSMDDHGTGTPGEMATPDENPFRG